MAMLDRHEIFEKRGLLLTVAILIVVSIGGIVEIAPLFYLES
ncbi:MAG: cbb3-type cytochrome c oxidase subunit II, partial [Pseudomonadota bacterium]